MNRNDVCDLIKKLGILPAIRVTSGDDAHFAAESIAQGGIPIVEITLTVPGAVGLISHLARSHPKITVGAGTVLDVETARECAAAGASFITSPGFDAQVIELAHKENIAVLPGALTPTEVIAAWKAGSDFVKVFPCSLVGGSKYIKALHTSLPQIPLIAAGGVNQQTTVEFICSGAIAVGVGSELIPGEAIERRQPNRIKELARRFTGFVREGRERLDVARRAVADSREFRAEECERQ